MYVISCNKHNHNDEYEYKRSEYSKYNIKINLFHDIKLGASQTVLSAETFWPQYMLMESHIKKQNPVVLLTFCIVTLLLDKHICTATVKTAVQLYELVFFCFLQDQRVDAPFHTTKILFIHYMSRSCSSDANIDTK